MSNRFLVLLWGLLLTVAIVVLSGCGPKVTSPPAGTPLPLSNPCATARPPEVQPLNRQMTLAEWHALSHKQRVSLGLKKGMDLRDYADRLNGATAACPEVRGE